MAIINDDSIVIDWNEDCNGGLYEVSIITQDVERKHDPLSSMIIRSPIIDGNHLGYRTLYDAKNLPRLEDNPAYKEFYDAVAGIYRSSIYDEIHCILEGARLENSQCDIHIQCELNNFVSRVTPGGVEWDQENLAMLMAEFGSFYSCDFTFKYPHYDVLNIIQYGDPGRCCTLQNKITRNDIGIARPHCSF